jgi:hypothetical protein
MLNGSELKGTYRIIDNRTALSPYQVTRRNLKLNILLYMCVLMYVCPSFLFMLYVKGTQSA